MLLHRDQRTRQNALFVFLKSCSHTATTAYFANNYCAEMMYRTETIMTFSFLKLFMHAVQQWTIFVHNHGEAILTRGYRICTSRPHFCCIFLHVAVALQPSYSVVDPDPDPWDPYVFGSSGSGSGSGSVSQKCKSGSSSKNSMKNLDLYCFWLLYDFLA